MVAHTKKPYPLLVPLTGKITCYNFGQFICYLHGKTKISRKPAKGAA